MLKLEGVVQSTRRVATLEPLLGLKVAACVRVYLAKVSWNTNQASRTLLCSHPFELGLSSFYLLGRGRVGVKSTSNEREQLESKKLKS